MEARTQFESVMDCDQWLTDINECAIWTSFGPLSVANTRRGCETNSLRCLLTAGLVRAMMALIP